MQMMRNGPLERKGNSYGLRPIVPGAERLSLRVRGEGRSSGGLARGLRGSKFSLPFEDPVAFSPRPERNATRSSSG